MKGLTVRRETFLRHVRDGKYRRRLEIPKIHSHTSDESLLLFTQSFVDKNKLICAKVIPDECDEDVSQNFTLLAGSKL